MIGVRWYLWVPLLFLGWPSLAGETATWTLHGYGWFGSPAVVATFTPAASSAASLPVLRQEMDDIQVRGNGTLRIPAGGKVVFSRPGPDGEVMVYKFEGPATWYIKNDSPRLVSGPGGKYRDKSEGSGNIETPAVIAGAHGTRYEVEVGVGGSTLVRVQSGTVVLTWRDPSLGGEKSLEKGAAAIAYMGGKRAGELVVYPSFRAALKDWEALIGTSRGLTRGRTEEDELLEVRRILSEGKPDEALSRVVSQARQNSSLSYLPAALFETWQVATLQGDVTTANAAARSLASVSPQGPFTQLQRHLARTGEGGP